MGVYVGLLPLQGDLFAYEFPERVVLLVAHSTSHASSAEINEKCPREDSNL